MNKFLLIYTNIFPIGASIMENNESSKSSYQTIIDEYEIYKTISPYNPIENFNEKYLKPSNDIFNTYNISKYIYYKILRIQNDLNINYKKNICESTNFKLITKLKKQNISENTYEKIVDFQKNMDVSVKNKIDTFKKLKKFNFITTSFFAFLNIINIYFFKAENDTSIESPTIFNILFNLLSLAIYLLSAISNYNYSPIKSKKNILHLVVININYIYYIILNLTFLTITPITIEDGISKIINFVITLFSSLFLFFFNYGFYKLIKEIRFYKKYICSI